ncbi:MAG: pseudouridine-5'-phosphate glycosidase [Treponema sp.]|jgi:pseudouridine-5'-phosphate glycosidase|nr:pseudouridine-5'-phosphate glycosidase [Treponema sp.]
MNAYLECNPEVKEALEAGKPVVALETTIISHGFNYPENLDCAQTCERVIREEGAVPATIGIVRGKIKIGLSGEEIRYFAEHREVPKCSRRDAAAIIARGEYGAGTVAATMLFASMAGIRFFATGGIGGVHRGAQQTFDISADLEELARTDVAVVCAGAKSILDIPLTLEYLETAGVTVLGFQTGEFPAFYTRKSGSTVDYRVESAEEAARIVKTKTELGIQNGLLITVPIPEKDELNPVYINDNIVRALEAAENQEIRGKATTPFLLAELHRTTGGKSVAANKALVFNNSRIAAKIAAAYCSLQPASPGL